MAIEPWAAGVMIISADTDAHVGSIGPIPQGIVVTHLEIIPSILVTTNFEVAATVAEQPARAVGDMAGQRPIFGGGQVSLAAGVPSFLLQQFNGIGAVYRWPWQIESVGGPLFINCGYQSASVNAAHVVFSAVGFRRVESDECRLLKELLRRMDSDS